ncbi:MAG TPA: DUF3813 family protein [Pseudogracilibacillus sp.]|nr:DUF3813 family protein [Pseudogracilibacillus sp.]
MEENLVEKAKEMMVNFTSEKESSNKDSELVKQAIQSAYAVASPEEKKELERLEEQLTK